MADLFCERELIRRKYEVELLWLEHLCMLEGAGPKPSDGLNATLLDLFEQDAMAIAVSVKEFEANTNHDTKAVELLVAGHLAQAGHPDLVPWVHFGCTSWDITNLAYSMMLRDANEALVVPTLDKVRQALGSLAVVHAATPMLGRTHSQPASPTTLGKEFRVFESRLAAQLEQIRAHRFEGKLNGAVGNHNALAFTYPNVDWPAQSAKFVESLELAPVSLTTQTGPHDHMAAYFDALARANRVLQDLAQDMSLYMGHGLLGLRHKDSEVGSSVMPHKVNPIDFENAEGNIAVANAMLRMLSERLQVSRLQRDLSDSTVLRNIGAAIGHSHLAWTSTQKGLAKVVADAKAMEHELDSNWQVLGEAVQTALRTMGKADAYDIVKEATRGIRCLDRAGFEELVRKHVPKGEQQDALLGLSPQAYLGDAVRLARGLPDASDGEATSPERK